MNKSFCELSVIARLKRLAITNQSKTAVIEGLSGRSASYGEFWQLIVNRAAIFRSLGLRRVEKVILLTEQTITYLQDYYGVLLAGGVAVPVEPDASREMLIAYAERFQARFIVANGEIFDIRYNRLPAEYSTAPQTPYQNEFELPNPDSEAIILLTTGTTGKSKGVVSTHKSRFCGADNVVGAYNLDSGYTALIPQLLSHSGGLRRVEAMFVCGGTAVIMKPAMFFGEVFAALRNYHCDVLQLVPTQVAMILKSAHKLLMASARQLKIVAVGSAEVTEAQKEELRNLLPGVRLFNDYGSTEAIGSAYFEWSAYPPKPYCVGYEARNSRIVFLDECGEPFSADANTPGLAATEGDTLMLGYYGEPGLTASVLVNGRVVSADMGYRGDDGMVYIIGRQSDIIVSGANKISPSEIETAVSQIRGVKECAVVSKPDELMGQMPALFIVWEENCALPPTDVVNALIAKLERFKVPKPENIFAADSLPHTPGTGKVIKQILKKRLEPNENS